jgi:hypothetical protein
MGLTRVVSVCINDEPIWNFAWTSRNILRIMRGDEIIALSHSDLKGEEFLDLTLKVLSDEIKKTIMNQAKKK